MRQITFHECVDLESLPFDPATGGEISWDYLSIEMMEGSVLHFHDKDKPTSKSTLAFRTASIGVTGLLKLTPAPELAGATCETWLYRLAYDAPHVGLSGYAARQLVNFTSGFEEIEPELLEDNTVTPFDNLRPDQADLYHLHLNNL